MTIQEQLASVPDSVKIGIATGSSALTLFGVSVQDWMYILSAIVSILFIIEKAPVLFVRAKEFWNWIKNARS